MTLWYVFAGLLPWLLLFGGAVYLIRTWNEPGPDTLHRREVEELREEVSLMRDFLRDAMERLRRLEDARDGGGRIEDRTASGASLPPGSTRGEGDATSVDE